MLNIIGRNVIESHLLQKFSHINSGIEVEHFRIDYNGQLSKHHYPKEIGKQAENHWITNDYLQTMPEIVTPPAQNDLETLHFGHVLTNTLRQHLESDELLWSLSMPPVLPNVKTCDMLAKGDNEEKNKYFDYIADKYGITHGAPCGTHINLSFNDQLLNHLANQMSNKYDNIADLRNHIYPLVAIGFLKYRWFLTYLFGASPVAQANYFEDDNKNRPAHLLRSLRQSSFGFIDTISMDYTSADRYEKRLAEKLADGSILKLAEFHGPMRYRGKDIRKHGIEYIELRMFDVDPFNDVGIKASTLLFVQLLMIYFAMTGEQETEDGIALNLKSNQMNEQIALENPNEKCSMNDQALSFIRDLRMFVETTDLGTIYDELLDQVEEQFYHPEQTISGKLVQRIKNGSLLNFGIGQAIKYQKASEHSIFKYDLFGKNDGNISATELKNEILKNN